nr:YidC/Oxa1 family membrane protein insertase [Lachnospiraceae bacterium]
MSVVVLTQYNGAILGPISKVLGLIMNGIFNFLYMIGIPNIGLSIILFTIVIYLALLPLTIRQQKFSKLSAKMNPEIQAIQKKYKDKKNDQQAMMMMNEETKAVYAKYGTSPTGSCMFLIIQMPILFALYRVIDNIPAYVSKVKDLFFPFVTEFINKTGALDFIKNPENFSNVQRYSKMVESESFTLSNPEYVSNTVIDILYKSSTSEWYNIFAQGNFPDLKELITNAQGTGAYDLFCKYNDFLGINIANSPSYIIKDAWASHSFGLIIGAILVPVLAAVTQWLNVKLQPQTNTPSSGNDQQDAMAQSMKTMNIMMPLTSAFFCFSLPVGMGIYWIAGAIVRSIQQIAINKYLDKEDIDEMIAKNVEKMKKKQKKGQSKTAALMEKYAGMSTKSINDEAAKKSVSMREKAGISSSDSKNNTVSSNTGSKNIKAGSIAEKANLVKKYNEN